jgi:hypothetical protein
MARTISQYFSNSGGTKMEQNLIADLINEAIKINGIQIFYVPRTLVKEDPIFGEDPLSKFVAAFPIAAYFDNPAEGYQGDRYLVSKFGMEMRKQANFIISRRSFNQVVKYDGINTVLPNTTYTANEVRPLEGDLIYFPLTNDLWQIQFSEPESVFYQLGYRYIWRVNVEKYDYSSERFATGVPKIDRVADMFENVDSTAKDPIANNDNIIAEITPILDWSEENPFGTV